MLAIRTAPDFLKAAECFKFAADAVGNGTLDPQSAQGESKTYYGMAQGMLECERDSLPAYDASQTSSALARRCRLTTDFCS